MFETLWQNQQPSNVANTAKDWGMRGRDPSDKIPAGWRRCEGRELETDRNLREN